MAAENRPWYKRKLLLAGLALGLIVLSAVVWFGSLTFGYMRQIRQGKLDMSLTREERETRDRIREALAGPKPAADLLARIATGTNPTLGDPTAKVKIVEFLDYQCPFSRDASQALRAFLAKHSQDVYLVIRDYPLTDIHDQAQSAALAARCVFEQSPSGYWAFQEKVFAQQENLSPEMLRTLASQTDIDPSKYDVCIQSSATAQTVNRGYLDGVASGVSGTPTFFFNGYAFAGLTDAAVLEQVYKEVAGKL